MTGPKLGRVTCARRTNASKSQTEHHRNHSAQANQMMRAVKAEKVKLGLVGTKNRVQIEYDARSIFIGSAFCKNPDFPNYVGYQHI